MTKRTLTFREDPQFKVLPLVAGFLDSIWGLPWSNPLFLWVAFLSSPLWLGLVVLFLFLLFLFDSLSAAVK